MQEITIDQIKQVAEDAVSGSAKGLKEGFEAQIKSLKEELEAAKKDQVKSTNIVKIEEKLEKAMGDLTSIKANQAVPTSQKSFSEQLGEQIEKNFDRIKQIKAAGAGVIEFDIKAVANITTANGTNTAPPAITGVQQAPLTGINLRQAALLDSVTSFNTSLTAFPYTEVKPKDGDYSFLAEGEIKPQIDFTWETNYAKPVKAAAWLRLTDESITDVAGLQSLAYDVLYKKHQIKKMKGILFGDGVSPNPKGATVYARAFSAGDLALKVVTPNFMDVVNACITDIATTHNYEDETPYMASFVAVHPNDFFIHLVSAKDANGLPLYPTASLFNMVTIGGVTIVPEETIASGKVFVADMSKYWVSNYVPYKVTIGWVNDDFIKNQFVILGESRFHAFVKKLDEQAFVYDTITTIKTAITKP